MNTYYCVVKLDESDLVPDREVGFVVASSYQDAARKLEERYGSDLEAITYMAIITDSDAVMMDAEHCPHNGNNLKGNQRKLGLVIKREDGRQPFSFSFSEKLD